MNNEKGNKTTVIWKINAGSTAGKCEKLFKSLVPFLRAVLLCVCRCKRLHLWQYYMHLTVRLSEPPQCFLAVSISISVWHAGEPGRTCAVRVQGEAGALPAHLPHWLCHFLRHPVAPGHRVVWTDSTCPLPQVKSWTRMVPVKPTGTMR